MIRDADAVAGGRLTGDRDIGIFNIEIALELDGAGHAKNHDARPAGFDGGAQTAGAAVVEIGDGDNDLPPRPPGVNMPPPHAPGKAGTCFGSTGGNGGIWAGSGCALAGRLATPESAKAASAKAPVHWGKGLLACFINFCSGRMMVFGIAT
jgi:hypothetical protein